MAEKSGRLPLATAAVNWLRRVGPTPSRIVILSGRPDFVAAARRLWPHARILATEGDDERRGPATAAGADHFVTTSPLDLPPVLIGQADLVFGPIDAAIAPAFVRQTWPSLHDRAVLAVVLPLPFLDDEKGLFGELPPIVIAPVRPWGLFVWKKRGAARRR